MNQEGTVLLLTLLIIFTLVGITIGFSQESNVEINLAGFARDEARATASAYAGFAFARSILESDNPEVDGLHEEWGAFGKSLPRELEETNTTFSGTIIDESGKLNVNGLLTKEGKIDPASQQRAERLFTLLGLGEEYLDPLLDWLDKDNTKRMEGAEDFYYQSLEVPYKCGNGAFVSPGQLALVKGLDKLTLPTEDPRRRLNDYVTLYSSGKININTAPGPVLRSLHQGIDKGIAENIMEYRKGRDFKTIQDIVKVPGITPEIFNAVKGSITTRSSAFSILTEGHRGKAVRKLQAVLLREKKKFRIVYWRIS